MNHRINTLLAATLLLGVIGCGSKLELPPAKPLNVASEQLANIPHFARGPYASEVSPPQDWPLNDESLRVRIVSPTGPGPFPLIIFSHGFASDIDEYDALLDFWASHGFVSISPYHDDGGGLPRAITNSLLQGNDGLVRARVKQVKLILDHLDQLNSIENNLADRIDQQRIAVAGHSFGAFTAQQIGGAHTVDPETGDKIEGRDPRIKAIVAISPPGEMFDIINAKSWLNMDQPMFATTGTWDIDGRFVTDWRQHALSYETAKPGNNWLLVVEGADHYLGNLICRTDRDAAPQQDALNIINALAVSFLKAQLQHDQASREFFEQTILNEITDGFARLSHR